MLQIEINSKCKLSILKINSKRLLSVDVDFAGNRNADALMCYNQYRKKFINYHKFPINKLEISQFE